MLKQIQKSWNDINRKRKTKSNSGELRKINNDGNYTSPSSDAEKATILGEFVLSEKFEELSEVEMRPLLCKSYSLRLMPSLTFMCRHV